MHVNKLRVATDENGFVPAGEYFKRLAFALREANEEQARLERRAQAVRRGRAAKAHGAHHAAR